MAQTWDAKRLQVEREADAAFVADLRAMGERVGAVVTRFRGSDGTIAQTRSRRDVLSSVIWREVIKPYFIGVGDDPFIGSEPQSPYARRLVEYFRKGVTVSAERHVAIIKRVVRDPVVASWLTAPRAMVREMKHPVLSRPDVSKIHLYEMGWSATHHHEHVTEMDDRRLAYDPYHLFVYGNSPYRLSDRVWRVAIETRANIDRVLAYHIPIGTAAVDIAEELVRYLTPGELPRMTRTPYGVSGSYSARRLARTEVTAAAGRSFLNAAIVNPYVDAVAWRRTRAGEPCPICDPIANGGLAGDGVYPVESVPSYPGHPHCMCALLPQTVSNPAAVTAQIRREIDARTPYAQELRGVFGLGWLIEALLYGWVTGVIDRIRKEL